MPIQQQDLMRIVLLSFPSRSVPYNIENPWPPAPPDGAEVDRVFARWLEQVAPLAPEHPATERHAVFSDALRRMCAGGDMNGSTLWPGRIYAPLFLARLERMTPHEIEEAFW